ncbi:hypothetical protein R1flu_026757 [Riccia fluitans]|uniref:Uncharacterized protein n=1 Tax=Riccia fluitans TaxID=41844 RepID=A0ABD1XGT3_9MARC
MKQTTRINAIHTSKAQMGLGPYRKDKSVVDEHQRRNVEVRLAGKKSRIYIREGSRSWRASTRYDGDRAVEFAYTCIDGIVLNDLEAGIRQQGSTGSNTMIDVENHHLGA